MFGYASKVLFKKKEEIIKQQSYSCHSKSFNSALNQFSGNSGSAEGFKLCLSVGYMISNMSWTRTPSRCQIREEKIQSHC